MKTPSKRSPSKTLELFTSEAGQVANLPKIVDVPRSSRKRKIRSPDSLVAEAAAANLGWLASRLHGRTQASSPSANCNGGSKAFRPPLFRLRQFSCIVISAGGQVPAAVVFPRTTPTATSSACGRCARLQAIFIVLFIIPGIFWRSTPSFVFVIHGFVSAELANSNNCPI